MQSDEHTDPAWNLLKQARKPQVRHDFAARVLEAIQSEAQDLPLHPMEAGAPKSNVIAFPPKRRWILPALLGAAAVLAAALFLSNQIPGQSPAGSATVAANQKSSNPASVEAANLAAVDDTLEQELVAIDGFNALIEAHEVSELNDAELLALLN